MYTDAEDRLTDAAEAADGIRPGWDISADEEEPEEMPFARAVVADGVSVRQSGILRAADGCHACRHAASADSGKPDSPPPAASVCRCTPPARGGRRS